ncbi:hypothetical protein CC1G_11206 [Coprinopsis cinerea okayama7|uniref:Nucleoporin n=1 Tax=Coprinopsis cinerea (strain Okayama-7 / 130 / ATCC MYA-4618 / FGSC 9003) TaxID=240176 RepID=A8NJT9_COPC7|nr:hypothetical protein CC1G_11206 [Coprinopsis cinerea okayama7\|eukprot:XP_001834293.1 hypothetical protein CC1G_11206 [Coprinopsis cinerea okayama7\
MDNIHRLKDALTRALARGPEEPHQGDRELFEEIMVQKPRLLKLFDVGPRNAQEQREVESGKITIDGKQVAVNSDFARQVLLISQHLDCSEKHVASVLHSVMRNNTNLSPVDYIEATVREYHARRRDLADSIGTLLAASLEGERPDAPPTLQRLRSFVRTEILPVEATPGGQTSFAHRIFKEIQQLDNVIAKADIALKNATSNTVSPSAQGQGVLGYDILKGRRDSLNYERRKLAISLTTIAQHGCIEPNEIRAFIDWLSDHPTHFLAYHILTAVFISFEPCDPDSPLGSLRSRVSTDQSLLTYMSKKLSPSTTWKEPGLKAAILLKWTMFITDARHNDASLEHRAGFKNEELETQVWNAVQGDAFTYLAITVARLSRKNEKEALPPSLVTSPVTETTEQPELPAQDSKLLLLSTFETLVRSLITYASSELRKIKQRQEDVVLANARTERNRAASRYGAPSVPEPEKPAQQPRHDIAILYSFIGLLFQALPQERALQFWGAGSVDASITYLEFVEATAGRLPAFLQWAVWSTSSQDLIMLTALYDMINGLAKGQQCSELAYNFLARGTGEVLPGSSISSSTAATPAISWTAIFGILDAWTNAIANPKSNPQPQSLGLTSTFSHSIQNLAQPVPAQQPVISNKDVIFAQAFLRLLASVVRYSINVRKAIAGHIHFRAIPTLANLIPLSVPLELKGALFDTLAAFCEPGGGSPGLEICRAVWTSLERNEVINVRGQTGGFSTSLASGKGVEVELEQIEAVHRQYPATIPFLKLLSTLIHTAKRLPERDRATGMIPSNTIPDTLGQPYRLPGVGPYTSFVIDNVFANIPNREYNDPSDRWRINDLCLCYIERAVAGFNLESLVSLAEEGPLKTESIVPYLIHPGFDVMTRLLSTSPLQASLLSYLVDALDGFEKGLADEEPAFRNTIIRVLRIVSRLLEIQDIFLDVLLPLLSEFNTAPYIGHLHHRSYFTKFDQALSFDPRYTPAIAQYMEYSSHAEIVLLSVKVLTFLSTSPYFTNLVALIDRSPNSERILAAFVKTLEAELVPDITEAEINAELNSGAGAPTIDDASSSLDQAIRLASLDLLIQDTSNSRSFPNLGHWLLFGSSKPLVEDPRALHARRTSIHVILELVNEGVPRIKDRRNPEHRIQTIPLAISLPALAERCYRVIYQLCTHPRTSEFVTRYLRTREDFFARQISNISPGAPECPANIVIKVIYGDGSGVITTVEALSSFLRLRSYIFDLVALELHLLTSKGHHKSVTDLLEILFGIDVDYEEEHDFHTFREVGQSNMRIVDFFQSLLFEWQDTLQVNHVDLQYLAQLNLQASIRKDANGCEVVDRPTLLRMISTAKQTLLSQGSIATTAQNDQLNAEINYVLESCAIENHRRQIAFSVATGFESWRRLLDLALTKCFDRLPHDRRENMLFDLLHVLPPAIRSPNIEEPTAVLLSETTLSLITKLREDRRHQLVLQSGGVEGTGSLPAERLYSILRSIVEGILDSNHSELIRGNLYGSLINFIHLVLVSDHDSSLSDDSKDVFNLDYSSRQGSPFSGSTRSLALVNSTGSSRTAKVESGILSSLKPGLERLVAVVARDAIDGTEVWKTVAFMLLDAITQLSSLEKPHVALSALDRHGILTNFVRGLKDSDALLQSVLKPEPDDLNPLYVYEAKMSLFIRMAQTRSGAERLLEAQLIPTLAQCDYLDAMPEADQAFMDHDSFLPSAIQRYHQLFTPAVQVVNAIIAVLGNKHTTATNHALDFLSNHSSTIAILLKTQADYVPLSILEELHLVVNLCASVLPSVPRTDLLSANSGFGVINAAILSLSTRTLGRGKAFDRVIPSTDSEVQASNVYAFGHGSLSKFDVMVQQKERLLHKSVISYIGSASDFTEEDIHLVLSPITITPKRDDHGSRFSATIPTIGDALAALDDLSNDLAEILKQISDIGAELANKHHIGANEIQEILRDFDPALLQDLEIEQTRSLIYRELMRIRRSVQNDARVVLDSLEMLMLLLWRHLNHYANPSNMNMPPAKASVANAMRLLQTADPVTFRSEAGIKLAPILQKLAGLDFTPVASGKDWQDSQGYVEIMSRRLRDTAGLLDDNGGGDHEFDDEAA